MTILAHRGYWNNQIEQNSLKALKTALEKGYGFESDVRDHMERLVISHNIATSVSQDAEEVLSLLNEFNDMYCFAVNIKADGLKELLKSLFYKYSINNYFLFDMSVTQMVEFREMGLRYFNRQSEVEPEPYMYDDAAGVCVDGFGSVGWITRELLEGHMDNGKEICLVSPELHNKIDYRRFWKTIKEYNLNTEKLMLCTDYPYEAKEFFDE